MGAHYLLIGDARADLQFVTQIGPGELFVTGSVSILPAAELLPLRRRSVADTTGQSRHYWWRG